MTHNGPVVVVAAQSCWRCGLAIPDGLVCRRVMVTGTSHQTSYGTGVFWTNEARREEVVSLCPTCEDEVVAEEAAQRERQARRQRLVWSVIGGALFTVCAADAGIPWMLSLLVAVVLAVGGVLGRTLLSVVSTAWVLEYFGYNLRTNPEAMFPHFLLIIGGLMVSALVRKALTQWQVPERLLKKQQPPGQVLPCNAPKGRRMNAGKRGTAHTRAARTTRMVNHRMMSASGRIFRCPHRGRDTDEHADGRNQRTRLSKRVWLRSGESVAPCVASDPT